MSMQYLPKTDPEVYAAVRGEYQRQNDGLELIASENFVSCSVLEALGTALTNKYAEGLPKKRYYGGCEFVDEAETLAIERAKKLFGAGWANVQPHSGAQANTAVYLTFLKPGDTFMGMDLAHGGHLTHGSPVNFSGRLFHVVHFGVEKETGRINYDNFAKLARETKPKLIMTGASAYPREWDFPRMRAIADEVGAYLICDMAHFAGLVAAKLHSDPLPYCHAVTSTTHKTLRGPRGGLAVSSEKGGELLLSGMPKPKTYWEALDSWVFPGMQGGPLMHVIAAKAVAFGEALKPEFRQYCEQILKNAKVLAEALMSKGWKLVSGGTDNHLMLIDLTTKGLKGNACEKALERAGITVNKNMIPFDPEKPFTTSGIRIGTPALTTRGMKEDEMRRIAVMMDDVLSHLEDKEVEARVRGQVLELSRQFPLYDLP
jgi:glycine hydroxymethyltransferase